MENLIVGLLRVLCPHLKKMAAESKNPIDDIVVNIVCLIAGEEPQRTD